MAFQVSSILEKVCAHAVVPVFLYVLTFILIVDEASR